MILFFLTFLSVVRAQPCCAPNVGVSSQLVSIQNQMSSPGTCIIHSARKTIAQEVEPFTDLEVMARLIYAETFATKCTDGPTNGIMDGIATVIANRVKKPASYGQGIRGVVFKPSQFNSSLSTQYSRSEYKRFLCPVSNPNDRKEAQMWEYAKQAAQRAMNPHTANVLGTSEVTMTYYFKHFLPKIIQPPCFANPNSPNRVANPAGAPRECIGFFYDRACR